MDLITALMLGFLQGLLEWLPVSSEGTTFTIQVLLGRDPGEALNISIFLHLGTVLAAIAFYRKEVFRMISLKDKEMLKHLAIATTITLAIGIPLYFLLSDLTPAFGIVSVAVVGGALIVTGVLQLLAHKDMEGEDLEPGSSQPEKGGRETDASSMVSSSNNKSGIIDIKNARHEITVLDAVIGGAAQGFSIIPGISRSGVTTSAFLFRRIDKEIAIKFSFLMSIPVILIAQVGLGLLDGIEFSVEALSGLTAAFLTGFLTIKAMTMLARRVNFGKLVIFLGILALVPLLFLPILQS